MELMIIPICSKCAKELEHATQFDENIGSIRIYVQACKNCGSVTGMTAAKKLLQAALDSIPKEETK